MASLNRVFLIGNVGRDAELRFLANGTAQASFSLAVNRNLRGPDGEWVQETDWFNIVAWRDLAERLATGERPLPKGQQVYVEGRLSIRSWDGDDGKKQYRTEIVANSVQALGAKREGGSNTEHGGWQTAGADPDDLPFE